MMIKKIYGETFAYILYLPYLILDLCSKKTAVKYALFLGELISWADKKSKVS
jgi:hypothetical protein